jgi:uncharacterized protein with HEPN domain
VPPRDWPVRVRDILDAVETIQLYTTGVGYAEFCSDRRTIDAVLYRIGIIGEAVSQIPDEVKARHSSIPWRDIRNMRNVLTHVYFGVDLHRVWDVIENRLDPLVKQLRQLLEDEGHSL